MRGRKPKPEALKRLQGNPGKRKRKATAPARAPAAASPPPVEPVPDLGRFNPPAELTAGARVVWYAEVHLVRDGGIARAEDLISFAEFCEIKARCHKARRVVAELGATYEIKSKHGQRFAMRPEVKMIESCERSMRLYLSDMALGTLARLRANAALGRQQGELFSPPPATTAATRPADATQTTADPAAKMDQFLDEHPGTIRH